MFPRTVLLVALLAGVAGCSHVQTASESPNDAGYWYTEAPRSTDTHLRQPGNERTYRPLGGAVY